MKSFTDERIIEKCKELWPNIGAWRRESSVEVVANKPGEVRIRIVDMYDPPPLNLDILLSLAEFFGTKNIDDANRIDEPGCDTCDYGSEYGFELVVRPEPPQ